MRMWLSREWTTSLSVLKWAVCAFMRARRALIHWVCALIVFACLLVFVHSRARSARPKSPVWHKQVSGCISRSLTLILCVWAFVIWARSVKENKRTHCAAQSPECWRCSRMQLSACVCALGVRWVCGTISVCHLSAEQKPFKQGQRPCKLTSLS